MIKIASLGLPGLAAPQQGRVAGPRRTTKAAAMHRKGTVPGEPKCALQTRRPNAGSGEQAIARAFRTLAQSNRFRAPGFQSYALSRLGSLSPTDGREENRFRYCD